MSFGKCLWRLSVLGILTVSLQSVAWAQHGYMSAPILSPSAAHSLDKAILVIGIPPLMIFLGIFFYFYRRRKTHSHNL